METAGPSEELALSVGRAIADALRRRDFRQASSLFGPALLEALPPKALETVWERTEERFGVIGAPVSTKVVRGDRIVAVTRTSFAKGFADIVVTFGDDGSVAGLSVVPARGPGALGEMESEVLASVRRRVTLSVPVLVGIAVLLAVGVRALDQRLDTNSIWWGAAGWTFALLARAPLSAILGKRMPPARTARALPVYAGVIEEILRLAIVGLYASSFARATSIAFGWAVVEVLYGALSGFIAVQLASGEGERSELARMQLVLHGQQPHSGTWVENAERAASALYQAGAVLLVAAAPPLGLMLLVVRGLLEAAPLSMGLERARVVRGFAAIFILVAALTAHGRL